MSKKLSPEQSAKVKALFRAALTLPEGIVIPKETQSACESLRLVLFAEKKSWITSDPKLHAETEHLTIRIEKDHKGNKVGVRVLPKSDPLAGLEVFIAQAQLQAQPVEPQSPSAPSAQSTQLDRAIANQQARQDDELNAIERDLQKRLRAMGLALKGDTDETQTPVPYGDTDQ